MSRSIKIALAAAAALLVAVGVGVLVMVAGQVVVPTVTVDGVRVAGVRRDGLVLAVDAVVDNRNRFGATVQSVNVAVSLDGHAMGRPRVVATPLTLPARQATRVTIELDTPWGDALALAWRARNTERFAWNADGSVLVGGETMHVAVPIHVTGVLTRAEVLAAVRGSLPTGSIDLPGGWSIDIPTL